VLFFASDQAALVFEFFEIFEICFVESVGDRNGSVVPVGIAGFVPADERTRRDEIQPKLLAVCLRLRYTCTMGRFITVQAGSKYRSLRLNPEAVLKARARLMRRGGLLALMTIMEYLALSPEATGRLFGVSRQAVNLWLNTGVPADRRASVERVSSLTQLLTQTFKKERIPEIVREPMPGLADKSILSTISESGAAPVFAMLDRARSYVPEA
jgi:hypothetical protein